MIDKLDSSGALVSSFGDSSPAHDGQLAGLATPAGSFSHPNTATPLGIAVDQATHDLYVIDSGHQVVDVFTAEGEYIPAKQITATPLGLYGCGGAYTDGIAVDGNTGHVFVSDSCPVQTFEFDALGGFVKAWDGSAEGNPPGTPAGSFGAGFTSVAVSDVSDDVYVTDTSDQVVDQLNAAGEYLDQLEAGPGGESGGVAVDQTTGHLLVSSNLERPAVRIYGASRITLPDVGTGAASNLQASSATLNGAVNANGVAVSGCRFAYVDDAHYDAEAFDPYSAGATAPCVESVGSGTEEVSVHADVTGLAPSTTYHFRLEAENENGPNVGEDETFAAIPPSIDSVSVAELTASTVDLSAQINPHGIDTAYRFEYGTSTSYGTSTPIPDKDIGSGLSDVSASQLIEGLSPNITYHWRVVAANAAGTTTGTDHTFIYPTSGRGALPDSRAYEMVTPVHKNGALLGTVFLGLNPDVAEDGSRVVLSTLQCFEETSCPGSRGQVGTSYMFTRNTGGWQPSSLAPSATEYPINSLWAINANNGAGLFSMPSPPAGQDDFYTRQPDGALTHIGPVTSPTLGVRGPEGDNGFVKHATASLAQIDYAEEFPQWPFDESSGHTVYQYGVTSAAQPVLVGVSGGLGSTSLVSTCTTSLGGAEPAAADESVSADGRYVYFTAARCASGSGGNSGTEVPANALYARVSESESVEISARSASECETEACATSSPGDASFQGASADGRNAFFTDTQQLTDAATEDSNGTDTADAAGCSQIVGVNGCNLYEFDFGLPVGHRLVAVSAGSVSGGPRVQGVVAISKDGSHVYFVAKGVLTTTANTFGEAARDGGENLYAYERDSTHPGGSMSFVTTLSDANPGLSGADSSEWGIGAVIANVTPDGRFLLFTSERPLTGDDSRVDGGAAQVFRYDDVTGSLVRVSVGQDGFNDNGNAGVGNARIVPGIAFQPFAGAGSRNPSMSDDGQFVFFMSPVGLTAGALNDVRIGENEHGRVEYAENVYEFHGGRVSLVSDGRDVAVEPVSACENSISAVCLVGVSGSGGDVFFTSSDELVGWDTDTQLDYYDARVCTGAGPCVAGPAAGVEPCDGEACHGIPGGVPGVPAGGSAAVSGVGNQRRLLSTPPPARKCRKGFVRKHGRCVRVKHPRKKVGKARARHSGRVVRRGGRRG